MIEVLLTTGVWVCVYEDENLTTEELSEEANDSDLKVGTLHIAELPDQTKVDCSKIAAIRFNA
ncbi:hypothetical protein J7400_19015 [Shimia sp. R9_2]|uniref:hypothetical protein n=1 Tax=Shimia sp. R9_2 TaxID=2821112 RepID=UPI001ADD2C93|nr:hypothetical protein [Shimia sp. R9_2]MBO9398769.1 hypothetical protein [Shimia sp. R9_2]